MFDWISIEIARTNKAGRIFLYCWGTLFIAGWLAASVWQLLRGQYADAGAELPLFLWLFTLKALWPLYVASNVRKRGGSFGGWFTGGVILGLILTGLVYLLVWFKKPVRVATDG